MCRIVGCYFCDESFEEEKIRKLRPKQRFSLAFKFAITLFCQYCDVSPFCCVLCGKEIIDNTLFGVTFARFLPTLQEKDNAVELLRKKRTGFSFIIGK